MPPVTLSGTYTAAAINYYTGDGFTADLGYIGVAPGTTMTITWQPIGYSGPLIGFEAMLQRPLPSADKCFNWTSSSNGGVTNPVVQYGPTPVHTGVEWSSTAGALDCNDFTRFTVYVHNFGYPGTWPLTFNYSLTYTPAAVVDRCQYGSEQKTDAQIYTVITEVLFETIALYMGWPILVQTAFSVIVGSPILLWDCANPPPTPQAFDDADLIPGTGIVSPGSYWKVGSIFANALWHFYCQCKPATGGGPPPIPYTKPAPPNIGPPVQPAPKAPCSDVDVCSTLNIIINQLNNLSLNIQFNRQTNNYTSGAAAIGGYVAGTVHDDLIDSGTVAIDELVGLRVQVMDYPDATVVLPGEPNYLWNMGWISIDSTDGMIQEQRITRANAVWLPPSMRLARVLGWSLKPGVICRVTELLPAPP